MLRTDGPPGTRPLHLQYAGQAGSYFYGYSRILQLRAETELALGANFDRLAFNNSSTRTAPPDLLKAVREEFIPSQKTKPPDSTLRRYLDGTG